MFDGLQCNMSNLSQLSKAKTRSICAENRSGDKGGGGRAEVPLDDDGRPIGPAQALGRGWKVKPSDTIAAGATLELANIEGPGCIQHIWMTPTGAYRNLILRFYWDGQEQPSVECSVGDFLPRHSPVARSLHRSVRRRSASIPATPSTATGRCRSESVAA